MEPCHWLLPVRVIALMTPPIDARYSALYPLALTCTCSRKSLATVFPVELGVGLVVDVFVELIDSDVPRCMSVWSTPSTKNRLSAPLAPSIEMPKLRADSLSILGAIVMTEV